MSRHAAVGRRTFRQWLGITDRYVSRPAARIRARRRWGDGEPVSVWSLIGWPTVEP